MGRAKKAWLCVHTNKPHYSKGKCQTCYLFEYHQVIYVVNIEWKNGKEKTKNVGKTFSKLLNN